MKQKIEEWGERMRARAPRQRARVWYFHAEPGEDSEPRAPAAGTLIFPRAMDRDEAYREIFKVLRKPIATLEISPGGR